MASTLSGKSTGQLNSDVAIEVSDVYEHFRLYHERSKSLKHALLKLGRNKYEDFWALEGVSLQINKGDTFALIGENGSGKSTLLKCIARVLEPTKGSITINGKISALLELGAGFHEDLTGRENIYLNGAILGCTKKEMDRIFDDIVEFAELEQFIDIPVRNYSSGMYVRLGFSVAVHLDFDILLVDEVLAVGDTAFQAKCFRKIDEFKRQGKTIVFVSHALEQVRKICNKAAWLSDGEIVVAGYTDDVIGAYINYFRDKEEQRMRDIGQKSRNQGLEQLSSTLLIKQVKTLNSKREPCVSFATGEEMIVEVECEAFGRIEKPDFGLSIWTTTGLLICSDNTISLSKKLADYLDGTCVYRYEIPALPLFPGSYMLSTSVFDEKELRYDASFLQTEFRVVQSNSYHPPGLFKLKGHWSFDSDRHKAERYEWK